MISILQGNGDAGLSGDEPFILLADDLAPSETVQLDKSKVLAFVTRHGSTNSHTAILARTMIFRKRAWTDSSVSWMDLMQSFS